MKALVASALATGLIVPENQMLRFDYNKNENLIKLDVNRELKGRGAYFIATEENWNTVLEKNVWTKHLGLLFQKKYMKE